MLRANAIAEITPEITNGKSYGTITRNLLHNNYGVIKRAGTADRDQIEPTQFVGENEAAMRYRRSQSCGWKGQQQKKEGRWALG